MRNYLSSAYKSIKDYKAENPRALRLGLMTTGLGLMQGGGQTYDRPVSTVGLMGEAGLKGLGVYEAAREQDISQKQKGFEEAEKERRHLETLGATKSASDLAQSRWEQTQAADESQYARTREDVESRFKRREARLGKGGDGRKGMTAYQSAQIEQKGKAADLEYNQDRFTFVKKDTEDIQFGDFSPQQKMFKENSSANKYDRANLSEEEAYEQVKRRAVKSGVDEVGQRVYANAYGEQFTDEACTKAYKETKQKLTETLEKPLTTKMSETQLRKALYKKTGRSEDLYPSSRDPIKTIKETAGKTVRKTLGFLNRPVDIETLPRFSQRSLR